MRLLGSVQEMRDKIDRQIAEGRKIQSMPRRNKIEVSSFKTQFLTWNDKNSTILRNGFEVHGTMTVSPVTEYGSSDIRIMDLKLALPKADEAIVESIVPVLEEKLRVLESVSVRLEEWAEAAPTPEISVQGESIFLVHGRNLAVRETVRGFLERATSRDVIVLDEKAGGGKDILGKLLAQAAKASFAVVLLTGDDRGGLNGEEVRPRARQNVIMELGLFIGMLGREKVAVLYEDGVELPSDFLGVAYVALGDGKGWQIDLARELRSAGISASLDALL